MDELDLSMPALWADHHVLVVQAALGVAPGITDVTASAAQRTLHVRFDPAQTDAAAIVAILSEAGYAPGDAAAADEPPSSKPEWAGLARRVTATDPVDLSMSGDYRRY